MKILAAVTAALLAIAAHAQMPTKDNPACKERNPIFAKFPNSFTVVCDRSRFSKLELYQRVGPLAPVAANDAEAGRAKNRRVEMVLR